MGSYLATILGSIPTAAEELGNSIPPRIYNPSEAPHWLRSTIDSVQLTMNHQYSLFGTGTTADGYNPAALTRPLDQIPAADARHPGYSHALAGLHTQHHALDAADTAVGDTALLRAKAISDWGKQQLNGIVSGLNDKFHAVAGNSTENPLSSLAGQLTGHPPAHAAALSPRAHLSMLHDLDGGLSATADVVRHATAEAGHIAAQLDQQYAGDSVDYSKPINYSDTIVNYGVWTA